MTNAKTGHVSQTQFYFTTYPSSTFCRPLWPSVSMRIVAILMITAAATAIDC